MKIFHKLIELFNKATNSQKTYRLIAYPTQSKVRDLLFIETVKSIQSDEFVSPKTIQEKMKVGYARAVKIIEALEQSGIIAPQVILPRRVFKDNAQTFLKNPKNYDKDRQSDISDFLNKHKRR